MLKVLATIAVHNEAEFLPFQIAYLRQQGVEIHVIDNESTDDTRAICEALRVTVTSLDTDGAFDLTAIQRERIRVAAGYDHDWHLYGDADEWNLFSEGITAACFAAEAIGANVIRCASYNMFYTGEERRTDPRRGYFYGNQRYVDKGGISRLHKRGDVTYFGDGILCSNLIEYRPGHAAVNLNFGHTKPESFRLNVLRRRKIAWARGLRRSHGEFLLKIEQHGCIWDSKTLTFLPDTPHWPLAREVIELNEPVE